MAATKFQPPTQDIFIPGGVDMAADQSYGAGNISLGTLVDYRNALKEGRIAHQDALRRYNEQQMTEAQRQRVHDQTNTMLTHADKLAPVMSALGSMLNQRTGNQYADPQQQAQMNAAMAIKAMLENGKVGSETVENYANSGYVAPIGTPVSQAMTLSRYDPDTALKSVVANIAANQTTTTIDDKTSVPLTGKTNKEQIKGRGSSNVTRPIAIQDPTILKIPEGKPFEWNGKIYTRRGNALSEFVPPTKAK